MSESNATDTRRDDDGPARRMYAEHCVGQRIRVQRADGWNVDQWAVIAMVVTSRGRLCWLVEYFDGATDVVPIFDNPDRYDLAEQPPSRSIRRSTT